MQALGAVLLAVGVVVSLRERKYRLMWRSQSVPVTSPLAAALSQLVGTAGGIYLALELLCSFLKIPEDYWGSAIYFVEPLAAFSLLLAILQPFALSAWARFRS